MKLYLIKAPSISKSLKRTYNKQLEVYEYDDAAASDRIMTIHKKQVFKNGEFELTVCSESFQGTKNVEVLTNLDFSTRNCDYMVFNSLELALAGKIKLLNILKERFHVKIKDLQDTLDRNFPETEKALAKIKDSNPEIFI